jgi:hypothetical protein
MGPAINWLIISYAIALVNGLRCFFSTVEWKRGWCRTHGNLAWRAPTFELLLWCMSSLLPRLLWRWQHPAVQKAPLAALYAGVVVLYFKLFFTPVAFPIERVLSQSSP